MCFDISKEGNETMVAVIVRLVMFHRLVCLQYILLVLLRSAVHGSAGKGFLEDKKRCEKFNFYEYVFPNKEK